MDDVELVCSGLRLLESTTSIFTEEFRKHRNALQPHPPRVYRASIFWGDMEMICSGLHLLESTASSIFTEEVELFFSSLLLESDTSIFYF